MFRSNFSPAGLNIGNNDTNMAYLYGISDFFSIMFEDTTKVNLLLEGGAELTSSCYSKFLQLTSNISLDEIQTTLNQTLKLVTLKTSDKVIGEVNVYELPSSIMSTRYIANRPMLPTALLEEGVDYRIEKFNGKSRIRFAKDISNAGFSTRLLKDEVTKEYALWFVDTKVDEAWISSNYASLIGVDPQTSSDAYKNFVKGLYYIYMNGPTLELLRKGLNLCLGVPLARGEESVIDVRKYLETDQYLVVTDSNQYLIPYGLVPTVTEGDTLSTGDELAKWVEIKDYINDGDWWINLRIPPELIPFVPEGQKDRYATKGSHFDYLMRSYLKKHTFLVNVKVSDFKNNQVFQQLSDIIRKAKPSYTEAIYIWTIPNDEELSLTDDWTGARRDIIRTEHFNTGIEYFVRDNTINPVSRGEPMFIRYNVPDWVSKICGTDDYINGKPFNFLGGSVTGYVNNIHQYRENTGREKAWIKAIRSRSTELITTPRSHVGFNRGYITSGELSGDYTGTPVNVLSTTLGLPPGSRMVPMYITNQKDLAYKCAVSGIETPDMSRWAFKIYDPSSNMDVINHLEINSVQADENKNFLVDNFNTFKSRGADTNYLSAFIPNLGFNLQYTETYEIKPSDLLVGVRIHDDVLGIYLVKSTNPESSKTMYSIVEEGDPLEISMTAPITRGLGPTSSSYYLLRGRGDLDYNITTCEVNAQEVNEDLSSNGGGVTNANFSDLANPAPRTLSRNRSSIIHKMNLK